MKECWSPWYYYDNTYSGSIACAATTTFFSVFSIIYVCHCLDGGDSSQFFLPLFETDVDDTMKYAGGFLLIFYLAYIINAGLMVRGMQMDHRGLMLPWLIQNFFYILLIITFAIWLQASYYHYLLSVLWVCLYSIFAGVHIYMHRCVKSQYERIKTLQSQNIVLLYP
ncbi:septate junction component pasiflora 1 [Oratosquilla oratoria]|uniref:septate junction component pasiflora 1 n=1 Tax=Oratosquilla oratoria TaxID=337810 RepID=UPI003F7780B0